MEIDPEEFRRRYAELSDEGILSINREDLTEVARQCYDAEVAGRGLHSDSSSDVEQDPDGGLVLVETFLSPEEARFGRDVLRSGDVPAYLENELSSAWTGNGGLRLMVPASFLEQANEILGTRMSDEELLAQAEVADPNEAVQDEERSEEER